MAGRKFDESIKIRQWVENAIERGVDNPTDIIQWIEQKYKGENAPSLGTVIRVMRNMGYSYVDGKWIVLK